MTGAAELMALLEGLPPGTSMWMSTRGRSMAPLLRTGDALRVLRCDAEAVSRGDIAVLKTSSGQLLAHVVTGVAPLRTATFSGVPDEDGMLLLGKAIAVRRNGHVTPLPEVARPLLLGGQWLWSWMHRAVRPLRPGGWVGTQLLGSKTRAVRRTLAGPISTRRLAEGDLQLLAQVVPPQVAPDERSLRALVTAPSASAVAEVRGRAVGVACVSDSRLVWYHLNPLIQGLGGERELLEAVCSSLLVVPATWAFLASVLEGLGFHPTWSDGRQVGWSRE